MSSASSRNSSATGQMNSPSTRTSTGSPDSGTDPSKMSLGSLTRSMAPLKAEESSRELSMKVSSLESALKSISDSLARVTASTRAHYELLDERIQPLEASDAMSKAKSRESESQFLPGQSNMEMSAEFARQEAKLGKMIKESLDDFRVEYNAVLAEMRKHKDPMAPEDSPGLPHRLQELRKDLEDTRLELHSKFSTVHELCEQQRQAISHTESTLVDIRQEVQNQREFVENDKATITALHELRGKCAAMQQDTLNSLQDLGTRCSSDLKSLSQEFFGSLHVVQQSLQACQAQQAAVGSAARDNAGTDQTIKKLRADMELDRVQADLKFSEKIQKTESKLERLEATSQALERQLGDSTRHLDEVKQARNVFTIQREDLSSKIDAVQRMVERDQLERSRETAMFRSRLDVCERSAIAAPDVQAAGASTTASMSSMPDAMQIRARLDAVESSCRDLGRDLEAQYVKCLRPEDLAATTTRLDILEAECNSVVKEAFTRTTADMLKVDSRLNVVENTCREQILSLAQRLDSAPTAEADVSGQIQKLGVDLRAQLVSEVDKRIGSSGVQSTMMNTIATEVIRLVADVGSRVGNMENKVSDVTGQRMINLEGEVQRHSLTLAKLMDRGDKLNTGGQAAHTEDPNGVTMSTLASGAPSVDSAAKSDASFDTPAGAEINGWVSKLQQTLADNQNVLLQEASRSASAPQSELGPVSQQAATSGLAPLLEHGSTEHLSDGLKESLQDLANAVNRTIMVGSSPPASRGGSLQLPKAGGSLTMPSVSTLTPGDAPQPGLQNRGDGNRLSPLPRTLRDKSQPQINRQVSPNRPWSSVSAVTADPRRNSAEPRAPPRSPMASVQPRSTSMQLSGSGQQGTRMGISPDNRTLSGSGSGQQNVRMSSSPDTGRVGFAAPRLSGMAQPTARVSGSDAARTGR